MGRRWAARGSGRQPAGSAPSRHPVPSSPSSTGRGTGGLGRFKSLCPFWGAQILTLGRQDSAGRAPGRHRTAWTQGLRGCQVTWAQPHPSPETGGQPGQRQDPKGPFSAQGAQLLPPSSQQPLSAAGPGCNPCWGLAPTSPHCMPDIHIHGSAPHRYPLPWDGVGPAIATALLAEHPVLMPSCSVPKSCLHHLPRAKTLSALPGPPGSGRIGRVAGTQEG